MFIPLYDDNPLKHLPRPYVNYTLIALNIVAFFLAGGMVDETLQISALGLGYIPAVSHDYVPMPAEYYMVPSVATYVTYAFLHGNLLHLGGNMIFLWVFGDNVEDALGHSRYLLFYLASAAAAAFVHGAVFPDSVAPLIGASGAVAGVVGAYLFLHPRVKLWILVLGRIPLKFSAAPVLVVWALFQVVNVFIAAPEDEQIAWWAHIGGFAAGALLVLVMRRPGVPLFDRALPEAPPNKG